MNLLHYTERETPPDQWRWKCKRTGHTIAAMDKASWLERIEKFNRDNDFALEEGWREQAEHELCLLLPPGFCRYQDGSSPAGFINTRSSVETIMAGGRVYLEFIRSGGRLVEPALAEERGKTCAACFAAVPAPGCGACVGLANLVMDVVGGDKTSADAQLAGKSCAWCGCPALANAWMPVEASEKGVTDAMLGEPRIAHCWKQREIRALRWLE